MSNFRVGDVVECINRVDFTDGSTHLKGQVITIREGELAYYDVCKANYKLRVKNDEKTFR